MFCWLFGCICLFTSWTSFILNWPFFSNHDSYAFMIKLCGSLNKYYGYCEQLAFTCMCVLLSCIAKYLESLETRTIRSMHNPSLQGQCLGDGDVTQEFSDQMPWPFGNAETCFS